MSIEWIIIISVLAVAVLLCFMLAIANSAGEKFLARYKEMNKKEAYTDLAPLEYVDMLNNKYFDGKLQVIQISKMAGDAYNNGKLFLSTDTINIRSLASYTIISHELGHAKQDKDGKKLKRLTKLRRFTKFVGFLMLPSFIAGAILMVIGNSLFLPGAVLIGVGVLIFLIALITKLVMISIEKDASKNAILFLEEVFEGKQLKECKKFLKDARLTYWADFFRALLGWTALSKKSNKLFG